MISSVSTDDLACCSALLDALQNLHGPALSAALGGIASGFLKRPGGKYLSGQAPEGDMLKQAVGHDSEHFGYYLFPDPAATYSTQECQRLAMLAGFTGRLLQRQADTERRARSLDQIEAKLEQQAQILNQMHESVITMDPAGFITSWNRGAEQLFGYTALEAIGRNVLFLYENEDEEDSLADMFLAQGGREMEVRRRKKSGETFWASLSLSVMRDQHGNPIGLIGYLNDITERKNAEKLIHHLAYYDSLTGLPNRTLLTRTVDQALQEARQDSMHGCVMFIDLNRFKPINDTLGHVAGDMLLVEVAIRLRRALREQDVVARLGADEFAVALFDIDKDYHPGFVAQKLLALFDEPFFIDGHELRVGASIGVSMYPEDACDTETLLRLADIAMYRAKQGGENNEGGYAYYSEEMNRNTLDLLRIETGLLHAFEYNELLLYYQPKVDMLTGGITGAEALVRWRHPERGLLLPGEFIPIAEETGLIVQLSDWVLDAVCKQARSWKDAGLVPMRIALNVTAREFTRSLPDRIRAALSRHQLGGEWLELEITESMLMHSTDRVISIMEKICSLGITISLDDFGTGYSSLSYLKRFPIHTLKIDRSFTMGIPEDTNDCAIASAIIGIAKQLRHKVIAEGVETEKQFNFLKEAGCNELQGYIFSRPVPAGDFHRMLLEGRRLKIIGEHPSLPLDDIGF
ncbi:MULTISPECIES: bifunctional diguanylate cyclase/phosphodiesterase [unclassified Herbaspirillum]|uniref:putative bifunctional diguanylate cyclase/phosphodiesterase n=1 Tax=unclassified Herbaspirillum TaxID=2624150 RepID=UPI0011540DE2|nr:MULTISPECIES: EAL domain-containing protein [unclassified Herbaspirillum]MBB5393027.1 diguanylate cyclase (GGDEF)-like protein/PAS domain S-box-containing protein [Herbaspirillum sp. SJZ102]TQK04330.1 PAS domain S-box-containing protein/diguanylate cyclase (GGDEF)-like protein [Herbaspirillum sp. SJZ130]TQK09885.1 PAS domain S-box-containing protein/diguanylate cyclase (GGDEF)-like protein [Herbaspirillum sp. SJZ106]